MKLVTLLVTAKGIPIKIFAVNNEHLEKRGATNAGHRSAKRAASILIAVHKLATEIEECVLDLIAPMVKL